MRIIGEPSEVVRGCMLQLDIHDVSKSFGGMPANDRISLKVHKGEIVGLIGPNGSGKTTLFNSIVGHHPIDSGTVNFEGRNIVGLGVQAVARLGMLRTFQQTRVYRDMTCLENIRVSLPSRDLRLQDLAWPLPRGSARRACDLLGFVGLTDQRDQPASEMSFGQQRLLELAMVLMNEPKLLLLDEPTAGINPAAIEALIDRLRHVSQELGVTLLVIEHNMPVIMGLADRIYCLNRGQMLAEGTPSQVQKDQRVIDAYLGAR
jgi:ABC-type branched-subunit amino acid transport system ATPase component